ncbi:MAG: FAD-dependent monooxygenase [Burkholderiaceae bacterium]|nr:FAD-dependent monooxygenase [Burkholderiaceae bacterium]
MTAQDPKPEVDIAVCGAGPVGLAFALLLVKRGLPAERITLIDAKSVEQAADDPRSIALSYGSKQIMEEIGAWPIAADAIHQIHVSRRQRFGKTLIDRAEFNLPALGYVARYGALASVLNACAKRAGIAILRPQQVTGIEEAASAVTLTLADGSAIRAGIAVQAEGGVFAEQAGRAVRRDYDQTGIIAQCWTSAAIPHRAFERFTDEGPLALLPQDDGYSLVWCVRPAHAAQLLALSDAAFLAELEQAFGTRVGRFVRITPRVAFPLGLNAQPAATARTVAIGNAAQTLHPVSGQGLNLGLRDAAVLAQALAQQDGASAIAQFTALRQTDRRLTIGLTDTLARIFATEAGGTPAQTLLGAALGLVDAFKPAKRVLAEHLMFGWRAR